MLTPRSRQTSRAIGALVGLVVGDALGSAVEFELRDSFAPLTDMVGGGPFDLEPGQWTDDSSMALHLGRSLVAHGGFDAFDQMHRYVQWAWHGELASTGRCFGLGRTTRYALERYLRTGVAYSGSVEPETAGNGSLMRLAPVPIFYADDPVAAVMLCGESSRTTHGARTAVDACRYFGNLMVGAIRGASKAELLAPMYEAVPGLWSEHSLEPAVRTIAEGSFQAKTREEIESSAYVVHTLEAALWSFASTDTFEDGALAAVNLGGDADTVGAVYGQIAGAFYGVDAIPARWRDRLAMRKTIMDLASSLTSLGNAPGLVLTEQD